MLDSKRLEPDGDFIPLEVQSTVCSKVKGGRYRATVLEIVESNVRTWELRYLQSCILTTFYNYVLYRIALNNLLRERSNQLMLTR